MIFEWYSGSDRTGEIPREIAQLDRQLDDLSIDERLRRFKRLLPLEEDPNWRGYLRFRIAVDLKAAERTEDARAALSDAIREFEPLAGTIRDVMPQYVGALQWMILDHLNLDTDAEAIADYASIVAANMSEGSLPTPGQSLTLSYLAGALNRMGHQRRLSLFYKLALNFAIRAHHVEPDDPFFLEELVYSYFNVRDVEHCRLAYEMFNKVGPPQEQKTRVDDFMRNRFHEIGGTLEIPS